jgi:hypothetical protein
MDQVSRFSQDRFRKAILESPQLREIILEARKLELGLGCERDPDTDREISTEEDAERWHAALPSNQHAAVEKCLSHTSAADERR